MKFGSVNSSGTGFRCPVIWPVVAVCSLQHMLPIFAAPACRAEAPYVVRDIDREETSPSRRPQIASARGQMFMLVPLPRFTRSPSASLGFSWNDVLLLLSDDQSERTLKEMLWPWPSVMMCDDDLWLFSVGDRILFSGYDPIHGFEPWLSDGTPEGTVILRDIAPGPMSASPYPFTTIAGGKNLLFFTHGQVWITDGTADGTRNLREFLGLPETFSISTDGSVKIGERWFVAVDDGIHGIELWVSDGTPQGAALVKDINPGSNGSQPGCFTAVGEKLYFCAFNQTEGHEIWVTDGTADGTVCLTNVNTGTEAPTFSPFGVLRDRLLFSAPVTARHPGELWSTELWISDGTRSGTHLLKDIYPGSMGSDPSAFTRIGSTRLVFCATDGAHGRELWITDGTGAGTTLLKDIYPGAASGLSESSYDPSYFAAYGDRLFFQADDGIHGLELWVTDGAPDGTALVKDLRPGAEGSRLDQFVVLGNGLGFMVDNGVDVSRPWITDGTEAGTRPWGRALRLPGSSRPSSLIALSPSVVVFSARDVEHGNELWVSDGTSSGTRLVKDINPGPEDSQLHETASDFRHLGDRVVFRADDGLAVSYWSTDGTPGGTVPYQGNLPPENESRLPDWLIELFPSSGCDAVRGRDSRAVAQSAVVRLGELFLFRAADPISGVELWASDGTPESAVLLRDIRLGPEGSDPNELVAAGDRVFFSADDGFAGRELWVTDGTSEGTMLFWDISPGPASSSPEEITISGNLLFFSAFDRWIGRELWAVCVDARDQRRFLRGDCNDDGSVDNSDAVCILSWLFMGGATPPCMSAANANADRGVDISDAVTILQFLFLGGQPPATPFPDCASSSLEVDEELGCVRSQGCL